MILPHIHAQNDMPNAHIACVFIEGDKQREERDCEKKKERGKTPKKKFLEYFP